MKNLSAEHNISDQRRIYTELFKQYGNDTRSLHWNNEQTQALRFKQLLRAQDFKGGTLLDIGCGLGDLYAFLQSEKIGVNYLGIDIVPPFIAHAKRRFMSARFELRNILNTPLCEHFDYVFASGLFAFANRDFFVEMSKTAFKVAKKAWIFNLYTPNGDDPRFLDISYKEAIGNIKSLMPSFIEVKTDYLDRDTTYFVYR
ncbi:MAG: class I SAM-dependent methyltransferase [Helicobacteraceae bacterium]|jgi:SAM-dependent methyltransferase|nr:class I SAM-dependent methyltransferase [Helicobacteraceae bacterium]